MLIQRETLLSCKAVRGTEKLDLIVGIRFDPVEYRLILVGYGPSPIEQPKAPAYGNPLTNFSQCFAAVIHALGGEKAKIEVRHTVIVIDTEGVSRPVELIETISGNPELSSRLNYSFSVTTDRVYDRRGVWPAKVLYDLREDGCNLCCCGTCKNALLSKYGGADDRHGIICGREDIALGERLRNEGDLDEWEDCLTAVSCFHWCQQYQPRDTIL